MTDLLKSIFENLDSKEKILLFIFIVVVIPITTAILSKFPFWDFILKRYKLKDDSARKEMADFQDSIGSFENKQTITNLQKEFDFKIRCSTFKIKSKFITFSKLITMENEFNKHKELLQNYSITKFMSLHFNFNEDKLNFKRSIMDYVLYALHLLMSILVFMLFIIVLGMFIFGSPEEKELRTLIAVFIMFIPLALFSKMRRESWENISSKRKFNEILNSKESI